MTAPEFILEIVKIGAATGVALVAAVIAWQQHATAHAKLQLDLFEKRYELYEQLWELLSLCATDWDKATSVANAVKNTQPKYKFLFDASIADFVQQALDNRSLQVRALITERDRAGTQEGQEAGHAVIELSHWFHAAAVQLPHLFERDMAYSRWATSYEPAWLDRLLQRLRLRASNRESDAPFREK